MREEGLKTPVLLASSTQAELDNSYGKSKKAAEDAVHSWAGSAKTSAYIYRLPNVFGKWCKPNYNSVVATFCYNIANNLDIKINDPDSELQLVYIDDVVGEFIKSMRGEKQTLKQGFYQIPRDFPITLRELTDKIYSFQRSRQTLLIPNFESYFDRALYATYASYLPEKKLDHNLEMKKDNRGWLAEFIKSKQFGQIFVSRTNPGVTRGNHWHHTKVEKFLVVEGKALIKLRRISSPKTVTYRVGGEKLKVIDIPPGYTHSITNTGKSELITLFWADEVFNPASPDTYSLEV